MIYPKSSELERDLISRLRETAAGNARAMAATIVLAGAAANADKDDRLVDSLMGRRPARVVHLRSRSAAVDTFKAWSSARCSMDRQNRGVCFEDIFIEGPDDSVVDARAWGPFVMRELSALLLWRFPLAELEDRSAYFSEQVDLLVIDGASDPHHASDGVGSYAAAARAAECPIADLAWERLGSMRIAASRLWEASQLKGSDDLIGVEATAPDAWSAALLVGWVASRSRWSAAESGIPEGSIAQWVRPDGSAGTAVCGISPFPSIKFVFAGGAEAVALFTGPRDAALVWGGQPSVPMLFPAPDDGEALARLIDAPVPDPLYAAALASLVGEMPSAEERTLAECG